MIMIKKVNFLPFSIRLVLLVSLSFITASTLFPVHADEKPVKHITVADINSEQEAVGVFLETTEQLKNKTALDSAELSEIHVITYSLEKAVAYFFENELGEKKSIAKDMVKVVEEIHLGSENDRVEETRKSLEQYFDLAANFTPELLRP